MWSINGVKYADADPIRFKYGERLRYEIRREFAPYIGINWARLYGDTADDARENGDDADDFRVVFGIMAWF
jgi:copper resistance protein B